MNREQENQRSGSPASQPRTFGPPKSAGKARRWTLVVVLVGLATTAIVAAKWNMGETGSVTGSTFTARRSDLIITVTEGGSIRAHKSIKYNCEVERRGGGEVSILSVVPAGTYVTQQDVDNGMILVQLDASALDEQLVSEKMELNGDRESMTSAKEAYDIQVIQNDSDVAESQLDVRFALMDLQKYLGAELAGLLTANISEVTDLSAHVAPLLEQIRTDPNLLDGSAAGQEFKRLNDEIVLAQGNMKTAQATLVGTEKLHDANYVSDLDLQRDRLTVTNRQFSQQDAEVNRRLFLKYDFPKNAEQYLSNYIEAGRGLERTFAQCRSRLAQAQATRSNAEERFKSQETRVARLEEQIANCTMRAKAPGLVIYGAGDDSDRFRQMRGRGGGGGSGVIAEGETVFEGQTIISMPDTASMVAEISVHETEVDKVRPGQLAEIVMDAFPDRRLQGRVVEVAPLPDQQRGWMNPDLKVYKTLVSIDGRHDFLKTRMSCKVEMLVRELKGVVVVPIQVVANRRGRKVVYVRSAPGGSEEREVSTGAFNDTFVQIIEGLEEGEEVLLNPPLVTGSGTSESFQGQRSRMGDTTDANDSSAASGMPEAPNADAGPRPGRGQGQGRMPEGFEMTPEMRQKMEEFRKMREEGGEVTPEMREQMRQMFPGQGGRGGGRERRGGPRGERPRRGSEEGSEFDQSERGGQQE